MTNQTRDGPEGRSHSHTLSLVTHWTGHSLVTHWPPLRLADRRVPLIAKLIRYTPGVIGVIGFDRWSLGWTVVSWSVMSAGFMQDLDVPDGRVGEACEKRGKNDDGLLSRPLLYPRTCTCVIECAPTHVFVSYYVHVLCQSVYRYVCACTNCTNQLV